MTPSSRHSPRHSLCRSPGLRRAQDRGTRRAGFTLLEVVIAMGILVLGLMVLVDTQASAVLSTVDADRSLEATRLAQEKMTEVMLLVEVEGFTQDDKEDNGDFQDFGSESWRGDSLAIEDQDLGDFHWAWTVRRIELTIPTDLQGMMGDLEGAGAVDPATLGENYDQSQVPDLTDMGVSPDMITDMLAAYIREVRVVVWWGKEEPDISGGDLPENSVELLTHVINPTGTISLPLGTPQ